MCAHSSLLVIYRYYAEQQAHAIVHYFTVRWVVSGMANGLRMPTENWNLNNNIEIIAYFFLNSFNGFIECIFFLSCNSMRSTFQYQFTVGKWHYWFLSFTCVIWNCIRNRRYEQNYEEFSFFCFSQMTDDAHINQQNCDFRKLDSNMEDGQTTEMKFACFRRT